MFVQFTHLISALSASPFKRFRNKLKDNQIHVEKKKNVKGSE